MSAAQDPTVKYTDSKASTSMNETIQKNDISSLEYLQKFWNAHASSFMRWFLSLPYAGQVALVRNACPDMPTEYELENPKPLPTQLITPELTITSLLQENGKSILKLFNARARNTDACARQDLAYLLSLRSRNIMPIFSGDTFRNVKLAYIDPNDPEQEIQSVLPSASDAFIAEKVKLMKEGKLIEADVWLTLQMRQQTILTLLTNIAHTFETMFLKTVMVGEVSAAEHGCRFCGATTQSTTDTRHILEENFNEINETEKLKPLMKCACEAAFYCCKEHQVADWKNHKSICKQIRSISNS